jgi:hypothetical protein
MPTHSTDSPGRTLTLNQFVGQPLVIALAMIMSDKFRDSASMMALTERNQTIQTFFFDRADEPFGMGIRVSRALHRQRAVRHKPFASPIPFIRSVAGRSR